MKRGISVLFLGKADDAGCMRAMELLRQRFTTVDAFFGRWGDPFPTQLTGWTGDVIISYLARWIVPPDVIKRTRIAAINFHPAPPNYPGVGCNNFALYEEAAEFGVTCHHMAAKVDSGAIVAVRRFPVQPDDDVVSLLTRTYEVQFCLFSQIVEIIASGVALPVAKETWSRRPFTRKDLNELSTLRPEMSLEEIRRRIRATSFGAWQPKLVVGPYQFIYQPRSQAATLR